MTPDHPEDPRELPEWLQREAEAIATERRWVRRGEVARLALFLAALALAAHALWSLSHG